MGWLHYSIVVSLVIGLGCLHHWCQTDKQQNCLVILPLMNCRVIQLNH